MKKKVWIRVLIALAVLTVAACKTMESATGAGDCRWCGFRRYHCVAG